jgi:hypothetical protein
MEGPPRPLVVVTNVSSEVIENLALDEQIRQRKRAQLLRYFAQQDRQFAGEQPEEPEAA